MLIMKKKIDVFEGTSEVDGNTVMTFKAEVDKQDLANSFIDIYKETESLYRQYRDQASADREEFEEMVFDLLDKAENQQSANQVETTNDNFCLFEKGGIKYAEC